MDKISDRARELEGEDLYRFMVDKGITLDCPSCGHNELSIISNGPDQPLHIMVMQRVHPLDRLNDPVELVGLVCSNCGNMRTFTTQHIVEWKDQEPADAE